MKRKMKNLILAFALVCFAAACANADNNGTPPAPAAKLEKMTGDEFNKRFMTQGTVNERPAVVDFNAEWCGPCKRLEPILQELAAKYAGQIDFFSINVDENRDVASELGIQSIPYMVFIPKEGAPQALTGFYEKDMLEGIMCEFLLGIKNDKVKVTYRDEDGNVIEEDK